MSRDDKAEARRKAILAAAAELFDARGYAATTVEEVAARAGIAKGSVYNYFRSKDDLFAQLFTATSATDEADANRLFDGRACAAEKVEGLLDFWFSRLEEHKRLGRLTLEFWAAAARSPHGGDLSELLQGAYGRWLDRVAQIIARGAAEGQFAPDLDPRATATWLIGVMHGLLVEMILNVGVDVDSAFLGRLKRAVLAALGGGSTGLQGGRDEGLRDAPPTAQ